MKRSGNATAFVEKVRYLDKEGRASVPLVLMLVILYQMRGYVAGIISLTSRKTYAVVKLVLQQCRAVWPDATGRFAVVTGVAG